MNEIDSTDMTAQLIGLLCIHNSSKLSRFTVVELTHNSNTPVRGESRVSHIFNDSFTSYNWNKFK